MVKIKVLKKDGTTEPFDFNKVIKAVSKSAERTMETLSDNDLSILEKEVENLIDSLDSIEVKDLHKVVEKALDTVNPSVAKSYREYRDYKTSFVGMLDRVYKETQRIRYIGDKENSNSDSTLVSTKRSLIYNELNKELYKKFFLTKNELEAIKTGYIYIHDMSARLDCLNCCLADIGNILKGGFEMGNIWYNEPKTLDTAFDVIGDIVFSASAQQYGVH